MTACFPNPINTFIPAARGRINASAGGFAVGVLRLPTDPSGVFALTLNNVVVGSRIRVEVLSTGAAVHDMDAAASLVVINLPAYPSGDAKNTLRIKVRKGTTSPFYRPYETQATAFAGALGIYIDQQPDE